MFLRRDDEDEEEEEEEEEEAMASSSSSSSSMLHSSISSSSPDRATSSSSRRIFSVNQYAGAEVDIIRRHHIHGDGGRDQGDGDDDDESFKLQGIFTHASSSKDQNHIESKLFPVPSEDQVTIEVKNMDFDYKHALLQRILPLPQEDNEQLLLKLRERIDK